MSPKQGHFFCELGVLFYEEMPELFKYSHLNSHLGKNGRSSWQFNLIVHITMEDTFTFLTLIIAAADRRKKRLIPYWH